MRSAAAAAAVARAAVPCHCPVVPEQQKLRKCVVRWQRIDNCRAEYVCRESCKDDARLHHWSAAARDWVLCSTACIHAVSSLQTAVRVYMFK
jgi:hypothetical protein